MSRLVEHERHLPEAFSWPQVGQVVIGAPEALFGDDHLAIDHQEPGVTHTPLLEDGLVFSQLGQLEVRNE